MPTDATNRATRFLATGHFREQAGYCVDRPQGCHDWLLIYTLSGIGEVSQGGWKTLVRAHDVVLISPEAAHRYEVAPNAKRWELLWAHFLPPADWRPWLAWPQPAKGVGLLQIASPEARRHIVHHLHFANSILFSYQSHREPLAVNAMEGALLWCAAQNPQNENQTIDTRIGDCLNHICRSLDQPLSVESLAKSCHLSPSRFAHLFREQLGMAPQQFIEQQRIARAMELLEHTGYSIAQIASQVGFDEPFYFSRRFKNATGQSPRDYRNSLS